MKLPEIFLKRMSDMLGKDFDDFLLAYDEKPQKGIRVNLLKSDIETVKAAFDVFEKTPFSKVSFKVDTEKVGDMALHSAGAFYSQEPSAASAVTLLDPKPGDKVLDLCAAPGGKSTQIAGLLMGRGLLWSNEVVKSRANILLSNLERMGVRNSVVSSVYPDKLCPALKGFFNRVLVDAPCSGEGMFRKNPDAVKEWSQEHVQSCAVRQRAILNSAADAVGTDGVLVYSTCTFSLEENEEVCRSFLRDNPEFELEKPHVNFGREAYGIPAVRIFPMDGGEGHFAAKFRRKGGSGYVGKPFTYEKDVKQGTELYRELFKDEPFGVVSKQKDRLLILPYEMPDMKGLYILRAGVELGEVKEKRVEPAHGLFICQTPESCKNLINLKSGNELLNKYLKGEEIPAETAGYTAVAVDNVILGFGKASGGTLKNRYPKGLRISGVLK